ncbi:MAG: hypothetical protein E7637_06760 [Ruminococcaceae bacterium]|nr:hypothetical protein [Oscillospiraceae bacterium]
MKTVRFILKILKNSCVYFTLLSLLLVFLNIGIEGGSSTAKGYDVSSLIFFPIGLCLALAQEALLAKNMPRWGRYLSHYAITLASIFLFLVAPSDAQVSSSTVLVLFALLSVLYWLLFGIILLIYTRIKKILRAD